MKIYADNAATTPLDPLVLEAMMPYLTDVYYNASSSHWGGMMAQQAVMKARMDVARHIGAKMNEIVFTSGSTEAINLAIVGCARKHAEERRHVVTVATEHSAVLDATRYLADRGWRVTFLGVDEQGMVNVDELRDAVTSDTLLVSVMAVNNETGVKHDLAPLSEIAHAQGAMFMTDATQAYGKMPLDVDAMGIDLLTCSGHKIYGPKGVGALFVRQRKDMTCTFEPMFYGGGQERGHRSGTLNVPGIVGLAAAGERALATMADDTARVGALRDRFERAMLTLPQTRVNGAEGVRSYNISNVTFGGTDVERMMLELPHVAVSMGSACHSAHATPSHVLSAMGRTPAEAGASLRFSFGRFTTDDEVDRLIIDVQRAHETVRSGVIPA